MTFFWFIVGAIILIFISIEITNGLTHLMVRVAHSEIKGTIISKSFSKGHKVMNDTWHYSYQYQVEEHTYKKRIFNDIDLFHLNDTVTVNYSSSFPVLSEIKK